ncbi:MAG: UbiA family prenyltransferase [Desulfobacterales bacterium]
MGKLYDYLELVRIPGVFTAHADITAGFLIAGGGIEQIGCTAYLLLASSFLYSAGMALNDYFDYRVDLKERPKRPIPSGRIRRQEALCLGIFLLAAGIFLAYYVRPASFVISLLLAAFIFLYNAGLKKHPWLGPVNMGGCRYLNLLLGLSVLPLSTGSFMIPLLTGIFIFGVTVLSRQETKIKASFFPVLISAGTIAVVYALYWLLFITDILSQKPGLILCTLWAILLLVYLSRLIEKRSARDIQKAVKLLIISLVLLDGIIVSGISAIYWTLLVWILLVPAFITSKKFYIT